MLRPVLSQLAFSTDNQYPNTMSSNILVEKVCVACKSKFTAKTTKTKYCSHTCNWRYYKLLLKENIVATSNIESIIFGTLHTKINFQVLGTKELLTIVEASTYFNITHVTLQRWINQGTITSTPIGKKHIIKRSTLDKLVS